MRRRTAGRACPSHSDAGLLRAAAGIVALVVFFVVAVTVIAGLAFSVSVTGRSMEPTLHQGDRLEVDLLHRHRPRRFAVVEAVEPGTASVEGGAEIVKRVIGLPGDRIEVRGGPHPTVLLRPAGSTRTYGVISSTWRSQVAASTESCCRPDGTKKADGSGAAWVTVPAGHYWVIGDNWGGSTDSRVFGFIPATAVKAELWLRIAPWARRGRLPEPARLVALR